MRVAYLPQRDEPAVFFACRTRNEERYWRMVSQSGAILHCEYLLMVRLIDPREEPGRPINYGLDLKQLFAAEAIDTCKTLNALLDPAARFSSLPASQRWSLNILRSPGGPAGEQ